MKHCALLPSKAPKDAPEKPPEGGLFIYPPVQRSGEALPVPPDGYPSALEIFDLSPFSKKSMLECVLGIKLLKSSHICLYGHRVPGDAPRPPPSSPWPMGIPLPFIVEQTIRICIPLK